MALVWLMAAALSCAGIFACMFAPGLHPVRWEARTAQHMNSVCCCQASFCAALQAIIEIISNPVNSTVPIASEILKAAGECAPATEGPAAARIRRNSRVHVQSSAK
jgi:hypothetical protein